MDLTAFAPVGAATRKCGAYFSGVAAEPAPSPEILGIKGLFLCIKSAPCFELLFTYPGFHHRVAPMRSRRAKSMQG